MRLNKIYYDSKGRRVGYLARKRIKQRATQTKTHLNKRLGRNAMLRELE